MAFFWCFPVLLPLILPIQLLLAKGNKYNRRCQCDGFGNELHCLYQLKQLADCKTVFPINFFEIMTSTRHVYGPFLHIFYFSYPEFITMTVGNPLAPTWDTQTTGTCLELAQSNENSLSRIFAVQNVQTCVRSPLIAKNTVHQLVKEYLTYL